MKSQQSDLEPSKVRFIAALGSKASDLKRRLREYLELPRAELRDDLRRRCHALATSARLFSMHELEETSRSAVSMLDVLRAEDREPSLDEAAFFETMIGRVQSLSSSHQDGSYSSSAFLLTERSRERTGSSETQEEQAQSALIHDVQALLRGAVIDRGALYGDQLRQRCEQMGAPHVGVLQRLRDGTPAHDLLADRAVSPVVLRDTLETLRTVGALQSSAQDSSARTSPAEGQGLKLEYDLAIDRASERLGAPQWAVIGGSLVALLVVLFSSTKSPVAGVDPSLQIQNVRQSPQGQPQPKAYAANEVAETNEAQQGLEEPEPKTARADLVDPEASEPKASEPETLKPRAPKPQAAASGQTEAENRRLKAGHGELVVLPGSLRDVSVKVSGVDYGSPPLRLELREGLHTVIFESSAGTRSRFWHVEANQRRQVSAP